MSRNRIELTSGRVLGPLGVGFVLLVLVVVVRVSPSDPGATTSSLDFTSGTSIPLATTTTIAPTTSTTQPDAASSYYDEAASAAGWTPQDPGDLGHRRGFVALKAGNRFVVWGGIRPAGLGERRGGASFGGSQWTPMATSPIVAGRNPLAIWTGREMFVYSGAAATWDPEANKWRELPYPPTGSTSGAFPLAGVWADHEVILVGYRLHPPTSEDNLFVASYGPDLGCCRSYADPPFSLTYGEAFWTGDEMLLIGELLDPRGEPATDDGLGRMAGLDPITEQWTEYEPPPLSGPGRISAAWTGTRLMAWRADGKAAEWTRESGWRVLPGPPMAGSSCRPRTAAVGEDVFAMLCAQAAVWNATADRWIRIWGPDTVDWSSDACVPATSDVPQRRLELWCSTETGNWFWRIDLSRVEATRYSEPATLPQWELLPNPAATRLDSTAMVWSGEELLYFSGHGIEVEEFGGWGYDPSNNIMHRIPDAPYPGRNGQVALWTGGEMLISRGPTTAWNPVSLEWRTTAAAPEQVTNSHTVWTGEEAIFYGSQFGPRNVGYAYNPTSDAWRVIKTGPAAVAAGVQVMASSGDEVYVFGSYSGSVQSQSGAVYDAAADGWRPLPPIPEEFALGESVGGFVDGRFVVVGVNGHPLQPEGDPLVVGLAYSPDTNEWRTIAPIRQPDTESDALPGSMAAVAHNGELAVYLPGSYYGETTSMAFYRPSTDSWRYVDGGPNITWGPQVISGDTFLAYLTPAGTVLLHTG